ncbi:MAG: polysaccharide biosynthesis/export family protein [Paludibacter sp.]|nr:polysaccharide biosynthesis/export family protein [Bacteroidales bacterium]MCM1069535.1 polysaccharide biosynthesis/export family protein [Prevotella sp.]MCM1354710.1 polysaccharide biosynthesis/export family protein [Bacteroides sp.]MCM1443557.1 polysaccharide biosynthesis/export family protein [Muribaculum sp.]MCM1482674.1 polysaccharide biosynthesis/export family protein [Paludibacter sp.]
MRFEHFLIALGVTCLLGSCVTARKVNYMQEADKRIPAYADTLSYVDYQLRKGDRLYIHVYSIDKKTADLFNGGLSNSRQLLRNSSVSSNIDLYTYLIDNEGCITFPTIGKVSVRGLTTRQVKHVLEDKLASVIRKQGEMTALSVEVQIVQRYFSVIGAQASGRFQINKEKITIFEALAMARDIADFGDRSKVHIVRETEDSTLVKTFDVRSADIINSEFYYIEPNDVIYVQKIKGQAFGINSAAAGVSVAATTISFGVFIYTLVDRFIVEPIKNNQNKTTQGGEE